MSNYPAHLRYTKEHEWINPETGYIGITYHAQDQLGDVVYLDLKAKVGDSIKKDEVMGTIESVKTVSDLYAPADGKILEVNAKIDKSPENVNKDPYGEGWLFRMELSDASALSDLMDAATYTKHVGG